MSYHRYGSLTVNPVQQVGADLVFSASGLIEGRVAYKASDATPQQFAALLGQAHPESNGMARLYAFRFETLNNGIRAAVFDCLGITRSPTDRIVSYPTHSRTEPIETHAKFYTEAMCGPKSGFTVIRTDAGTGEPLIAAGLNGSRFEVGKEEGGNLAIVSFLGFIGDDAPEDLRGVRSYYRGGISAELSWYQTSPPRFEPSCKIAANLQGVPDVAGVKNWLRFSPSAEMIPHTGLWRCTATAMASDDKGWSTTIYG